MIKTNNENPTTMQLFSAEYSPTKLDSTSYPINFSHIIGQVCLYCGNRDNKFDYNQVLPKFRCFLEDFLNIREQQPNFRFQSISFLFDNKNFSNKLTTKSFIGFLRTAPHFTSKIPLSCNETNFNQTKTKKELLSIILTLFCTNLKIMETLFLSVFYKMLCCY